MLSVGTPDPFYGTGGFAGLAEADIGWYADSVVALPDGGAYVAGENWEDLVLVRLDFDGKLDPTFGNNGIVRTDVLGGSRERARSLAVQPDGKILVASWCRAPSQTSDFALLRYNPDGTPDNSFGTGGLVTTDFAGRDESATKLLLQGDGKIIVIGEVNNGGKGCGAMARYQANGTLDTSFGSGGKVILDLAPDVGGGRSAFLSGFSLPDGSFMVSGFAEYDSRWGPDRLVLAKFRPDGVLDSTWAVSGQSRLGTELPYASDVIPDGNGGFLVNAGHQYAWGVVRFDGNGALDTSWGAGGITMLYSTPSGPTPVSLWDGGLVIQSDGSILASRGHTYGWTLGRILPNGQPDATFGGASGTGTGSVFQYLGSQGEGGRNIALQPDGRALIVGGGVGYPTPLPYGFLFARYRTMPDAAGMSFDAGTRIVSVTGTPGADTVTISRDAGASTITVVLNGGTQSFSTADVSRVDVRGLDGSDTVTVGEDAPYGMIDLSGGDDHVTFDGVSGGGDDALRRIFGGVGNDRLTLANGNGATLEFDGGDGAADEVILTGSAGDDFFTLSGNTIDAIGYAATYATPATELLTVNALGGADSITLAATLRARTTVNGGDGDDNLHVLPAEKDFYGNRLGTIPTVNGGAGADSLSYTGSALADTLAVHATKVMHGVYEIAFTSEIEDLLLFGGAGNDIFVMDVTAQGVTLHADGGAGSDTVSFLGSSANDAIDLTPESITSAGRTATLSGGIEGVSIPAGAGNDVVTISGSAPATAVTISGDAGDDLVNVNGAPWANIIFSGGTHAGSNDTLNVNAGTFIFAGDGRLTTLNLTVNVADDAAVVFNATQRLAALNIDGGSARLSVAGNRVINTRGLSMTNGGVLDLTNNDLVFNYTAGGPSPIGSWNGSSYTGITGLIRSGYGDGTWAGPGIATSMGQAGEGLTGLGIAEASDVLFISGSETAIWRGQTVDATTVIVKYTYTGDADLNGYVDAADYGVIDNWVQFPGTTGYTNGDLNYDGVIDAADYGYLDNSIQMQGPPL